MSKKLKTRIDFSFGDQEDFPELYMEIKMKERKKNRMKVVEHKFPKKHDPSTKLF